ncbi:L-piperidine-6-carboxylate dehydrogenase [Zhouia amylolytica]|uniref:aldehyde dehydrogenase (NAD(+)) n=1 Tax=Zhouia amylolytica AD3 TaxID=1286632 RepID=W2ULE8_9FLAO|nr:aldehyde dehydrogenase family protein [Zhouia amylolytica]ETN94833.1 L-aminoadipate-semialdehyde dehydrogenase [Zhouia amylolytica AD3]
MTIHTLLNNLNIQEPFYSISTGLNEQVGQGEKIVISSPADGKTIGEVRLAEASDYNAVIVKAKEAFPIWRTLTAPQRGEIVRQYGEELRKEKENLGKLVSYEMGKSLQEGYGEVQEMIDICDFAVGLSRQLYGLQIHSERPNHRMFEQWHPLGIVGIISAFNFPVAVWSWNTALAWVCGNVCVWKPSEKTPFSAIACQEIFKRVLERNDLPEGVSNIIIGDSSIGNLMASDTNISLVSATGSTRMGKSVAETVAKRLGKTILELGGNNAMIVTEHADLTQAIPAIVFGAVGTAGQRCTSTRRLLVHESQYETLKEKLVDAYRQIRIGNPLDENNHVGPLIDTDAVTNYQNTIKTAQEQGGYICVGGQVLEGAMYQSGCYVEPTIIEAHSAMEIVKHETFAPILYLMKYQTLEDAISLQNDVPQGLSSAIFTLNMREAETFLSATGSDCGIANVNIGTSGAEIGGAFGGEKETGGGRESGSDAWKGYMRRQTCTVNYGTELPLAQGIKFNL